MKSINILFAMLLLATTSLFSQTVWKFDTSHSSIGFTVTHLVISEVDGKFDKFDGKVLSSKDDFSDAKIEFEADINSIDTDNEKRDEHLKAADFFNAEKFPKLVFKSKSFEKISENKYVLTGDLTMKGVTKEVKLDAKLNGVVTDPWGNTKAGFKVSGELDRFDYGLQWNTLMETGGAVVGKEVNLNINIELIKS